MITIEEVNNGYIVTSAHPMTGEPMKTVFNYEDFPESEEANACARMLQFVAHEVKQYDKYGEYNVKVSVEKGHKL